MGRHKGEQGLSGGCRGTGVGVHGPPRGKQGRLEEVKG